MGGARFLTAFRTWFASLYRQPAGPGLGRVITFPPALLLATILSGCASVDVLMLSSETFPPQAGPVEILERAPSRPYVQIAVLTVDSWWLSVDSRRERIVEKAANLGADAVVFGDLGLTAPVPSNRTAEQSSPPPSLPSEDPEKVIPDNLHSSLQQGVLDAGVMIYLVRGGGHGGGRGGGHGHWGGRSGHSGMRHWRHSHSTGYWSGFYGPGWRGYGPYWGPNWGGYYPYSFYGGYPYSGYGYMNTLTVGTAIHYTE
jgi:hypothetical protein